MPLLTRRTTAPGALLASKLDALDTKGKSAFDLAGGSPTGSDADDRLPALLGPKSSPSGPNSPTKSSLSGPNSPTTGTSSSTARSPLARRATFVAPTGSGSSKGSKSNSDRGNSGLPSLTRAQSTASRFQQSTDQDQSQVGRTIKIGDMGLSVPTCDLKKLRLQFSKLDDTNCGTVRWNKLANVSTDGVQTVFSQKTMMSKNSDKVRRRPSMEKRLAEGCFSFADMLRFTYPDASSSDISKMQDIALKLTGETLTIENCSMRQQEAAVAQFEMLCQPDGRVYIDDLEDFLIEEFPLVNHLDLLRLFEDEQVNDRLYDGTGIVKEEFMMWWLKIETTYLSRKPSRKKSSRGEAMANSGDASSVFSSYLMGK